MQEHEDIRSIQLTLGLYVFIFAIKLAAYFLTGVMAVLAEALHTLSDIFIAGFFTCRRVLFSPESRSGPSGRLWPRAERRCARGGDLVHLFHQL
jgi:hypothetical protein